MEQITLSSNNICYDSYFATIFFLDKTSIVTNQFKIESKNHSDDDIKKIIASKKSTSIERNRSSKKRESFYKKKNYFNWNSKMRSKRNRKQIMSVLFALLNILLLCNGATFAVANVIEEANQHNHVKRSTG